MKRWALITTAMLALLSIAALALTADAQSAPAYTPVTIGMDRSASGSLTGVGQYVVVATSGMATCHITITGTWSATCVVKTLGADLSTWSTMNNVVPIVNGVTQSPVSSISANGDFEVRCGGVVAVEVTSTAYTSGTAVVSLRASTSTGYVGSTASAAPLPTNAAQETGGHLATIDASTASTATNTGHLTDGSAKAQTLPYAVTLTDRSNTAVGTSSTLIAAANSSRRTFEWACSSAPTGSPVGWYSWTTSTVTAGGAGCYPIYGGEDWTPPSGVIFTNALYMIAVSGTIDISATEGQ